MSGGYSPKVANPWVHNFVPQMASGSSQAPFYFGGSQTPNSLSLPINSFRGSGFSKDSISITRPNVKDFTTKKGDKVYGKGIRKLSMPFMKN